MENKNMKVISFYINLAVEITALNFAHCLSCVCKSIQRLLSNFYTSSVVQQKELHYFKTRDHGAYYPVSLLKQYETPITYVSTSFNSSH